MIKFDDSRLNSLIKEAGKLVDNDPLIWAGWEISSIKKNFEAIQRLISDEWVTKEEKNWLLGSIFKSWFKEEWFQYKSFEEKINSIFRQFDLTHNSIENSISMYEKYSLGLTEEIAKLETFLWELVMEDLDDADKLKISNYSIMLDTLKLSLVRVNMSLNSAKQLEGTMSWTRPLFQTLLSSAMIEIAGQRTLDAWAQMIATLSWTIETMSKSLTENTIRTSALALDLWTKPLLSSGALKENILLLWNKIQEMEESRKNYILNIGKDE